MCVFVCCCCCTCVYAPVNSTDASSCLLSVDALQLDSALPAPVASSACLAADAIGASRRVQAGKYMGSDVSVTLFHDPLTVGLGSGSGVGSGSSSATASAASADMVTDAGSVMQCAASLPRALMEHVDRLRKVPTHPQLLPVKGCVLLRDQTLGIVGPPKSSAGIALAAQLAHDRMWFADPVRVLKIMRDVADALTALHSDDVLHRDGTQCLAPILEPHAWWVVVLQAGALTSLVRLVLFLFCGLRVVSESAQHLCRGCGWSQGGTCCAE
jgi:hypothetical protein